MDVGHRQNQIYHTFMAFWSGLAPGGLYFIEDLQVSRLTVRHNRHFTSNGM